MATEQDIEDTDAVISDNDTSTVFPDGTPAGDFDASGNPYDNPYQLHRPHAFALMHGDGGAKISYGQLLWRIDTLTIQYGSGVANNSSQGAINGLNVKVPTINTEDGKPMSSNINDIDEDGTPTGLKYHQLDGYGDVYLYWKVDLDDANRVTKCWVTVDGTTPESDVPALTVDAANRANDRTTEGTANRNAPTDDTGTYRVKIGSVNDGDPIKQDISSDVYWSILVHIRTEG